MGLQSEVCLNPHTGDLTLPDMGSKLLSPLLRIPEAIDFLSDVELKMAAQAKPHETVDGIVKQIAELQVRSLLNAIRTAVLDLTPPFVTSYLLPRETKSAVAFVKF